MTSRMLLRTFAQPLRSSFTRTQCPRVLLTLRSRHVEMRGIQTSLARRDRSFTNLLADEIPPPVQVGSITDDGILLADGLLLPSSCIFHDGHVFLWDVPQKTEGWGPERFELFESSIPRPEILVLGTGRTSVQPPPSIRSYLNNLGIQVDVMDTRNACSTYNLLAEEGRRVAAALLPLTPQAWHKVRMPRTPNSTQHS
ncbi:NADH dehydrogenase [ubiquinone] 1 alpha subcomplex assembly factor 3 [Leucoagaricus sp. SymC.cos]|nr:NADH dehydrogenase [ubiquinone] 1 alpha subcomplex assembly factor 3 [Leucoagaricus sp. SymC.cos]